MSLIQDYFMRYLAEWGISFSFRDKKNLCWLTGKDLHSVPLINVGHQVQSALYYYVQ